MTDKFVTEFQDDLSAMLIEYDNINPIPREELDDLARDVLDSMLIYDWDITEYWLKAGRPEPDDDMREETIIDRMIRALIGHALSQTDLVDIAGRVHLAVKED